MEQLGPRLAGLAGDLADAEAVPALREQMLEGGMADVSFEPADYDDELSGVPAHELN